MPGIYVAKPATTSTPSVPPGWDVDWPRPGDTDTEFPGIDPDPFFPAPYPSGYTPALTMVMTADDSLLYDGTATVTGSARDHSTYATNEPSDITWSAAIDGNSVNLRFSGDEDYSSSLSSSVSFSTYWGAAPSIEFELTEDNADDVVTLTGSYVLDGVRIENTEEITIVVPITLQITMSWSVGDPSDPNEWTWDVYARVREADTPRVVLMFWLNVDDDTGDLLTQITREAESTITYAGYPATAATLNVTSFAYEGVHTINVGHNVDYNRVATLTLNATVYQGDTELEVLDEKITTTPDGIEDWFTVDSSDGTVVVINP